MSGPGLLCSSDSALAIAKWLEKHAAVERVLYPGLPSHPQHALARRQMQNGYSGIVTFFIKGGLDEARHFLERLELFTLAESLGGVESLIEHPAIMTHASIRPEVRAQLGIDDGLVRLSVRVEDIADLLTATYDGAVPTVFPQHSGMSWYDWYKVMVPLSVMRTNASNLGVALDPDLGHVLFLAWEGLNLGGVNTAKVRGVTAEVDVGEVFYASSLGLAAQNATETTASGSGGSLNQAPGVRAFTFEGPGGACEEPMFHWARGPDGSVPVPVLAGFTTAVDVMCPP